MSTPLNPPLAWQSAQISVCCAAWACVRLPNEALPKLVTWPIAVGESWHAVQAAAQCEITGSLFMSMAAQLVSVLAATVPFPPMQAPDDSNRPTLGLL